MPSLTPLDRIVPSARVAYRVARSSSVYAAYVNRASAARAFFPRWIVGSFAVGRVLDVQCRFAGCLTSGKCTGNVVVRRIDYVRARVVQWSPQCRRQVLDTVFGDLSVGVLAGVKVGVGERTNERGVLVEQFLVLEPGPVALGCKAVEAAVVVVEEIRPDGVEGSSRLVDVAFERELERGRIWKLRGVTPATGPVVGRSLERARHL